MQNQQAQIASTGVPQSAVAAQIAQLAREASVEINVQDVKHLEASREFLAPGTRVFVSHLPRQTWEDTAAAARAVSAAGFEPVPHIPVRLLADATALDRTLAALAERANVREVLLISGDYPDAIGPYSAVAEVLRSGALPRHGFKKVSIAGHPEGHPRVPLEVIRAAERDKVRLATDAGLTPTLVTQFFFEHDPFLDWVADLRSHGVRADIVGGLAGPAGLATLLKFAMRCGAGPSIRALGARPSSVMKLVGEHGPESVLRGLAQARAGDESDFTGIHLFCFGGYLRTCRWLRNVAAGHFHLNHAGGFDIRTTP